MCACAPCYSARFIMNACWGLDICVYLQRGFQGRGCSPSPVTIGRTSFASLPVRSSHPPQRIDDETDCESNQSKYPRLERTDLTVMSTKCSRAFLPSAGRTRQTTCLDECICKEVSGL